MSVRQLTPITECRVLFISNIQFKIIASKSFATAIVAVARAGAVSLVFAAVFDCVQILSLEQKWNVKHGSGSSRTEPS